MPIEYFDVAGPQTLVVVLSPPSEFNRLFILTGTAHFTFPPNGPRKDDLLGRDRGTLNLSSEHGDLLFPPQTTQVVASASLANLTGSDAASDLVWAIEKAVATIGNDGRLFLNADIACGGAGNQLQQITYHAFVQTRGLDVLEFGPEPRVVSFSSDNSPITIRLRVQLSGVAVNGDYPVMLSYNPSFGNVQFPRVLNVPQGQFVGTISFDMQAHVFVVGTSELTITATTCLNKKSSTIIVTRSH